MSSRTFDTSSEPEIFYWNKWNFADATPQFIGLLSSQSWFWLQYFLFHFFIFWFLAKKIFHLPITKISTCFGVQLSQSILTFHSWQKKSQILVAFSLLLILSTNQNFTEKLGKQENISKQYRTYIFSRSSKKSASIAIYFATCHNVGEKFAKTKKKQPKTNQKLTDTFKMSASLLF